MILPSLPGCKEISLAKRPNIWVLLYIVTGALINMMAVMFGRKCLITVGKQTVKCVGQCKKLRFSCEWKGELLHCDK